MVLYISSKSASYNNIIVQNHNFVKVKGLKLQLNLNIMRVKIFH